VDEFAMGFGRPLLRWTDRSGVQWQIGWIPLGGYVRMFGQAPNELEGGEKPVEMSADDRAVSFMHKSVGRRAAISLSLDAWLHRRCPFRIAVAPSIAVAVALPSCRPSPPSLVDCCRFHRHRRVNVHPPLLPLRSLCCACHRRPSPSRHPLPPSLVDCCIFYVHCRIAVHYRRSVAPTIAVDAVAVALLSRCPCPSPPSLVDCCLAVGSHWGSKQ